MRSFAAVINNKRATGKKNNNININSPLRHCSKLEYQHILHSQNNTTLFIYPSCFGDNIMHVFFYKRTYVNINTDTYADQIRLKSTVMSIISIIFTHHLIPHFPETVPPLYLSIIIALYHIFHICCVPTSLFIQAALKMRQRLCLIKAGMGQSPLLA